MPSIVFAIVNIYFNRGLIQHSQVVSYAKTIGETYKVPSANGLHHFYFRQPLKSLHTIKIWEINSWDSSLIKEISKISGNGYAINEDTLDNQRLIRLRKTTFS
jgi:hypothetical protein